jgi:NADPH-dependent curcumin reductase CurA
MHQQATILGFLIVHYGPHRPEAMENLLKWVDEGKVELLKSVYEVPLEEVPDVFRYLFDGKGVGKVITKLAW